MNQKLSLFTTNECRTFDDTILQHAKDLTTVVVSTERFTVPKAESSLLGVGAWALSPNLYEL